jgi:tetratricopeptide (TPR) repeat protein
VRDLERGRVQCPHWETVRLLAGALSLTGADLERFEAAAGGAGPDRDVPAQLPPDAYGFTGRAGELAALGALLAGAPEQPTAVVISAVSGTAGVGKTALAVHWAHRVADRFPDGQLYLDLRGYGPDEPVPPADALAGLLRSLGVPDEQIPADLSERATRYRSETAGRRLLVLLDNARSSEQVRPLLPGSATCLVVVTSRDSLPGLVAKDGARRLDLDVLPIADAVALLCELIGERAEADLDSVHRLAHQCARLPLALRVAAERTVVRPEAPLRDLVDELAGRRRLDVLDGDGDPRAAVRTVFSWSYRQLPADAARVFRLLGLHPGTEADAGAVAALAGTGLEPVRRQLDLLARAHLVRRTAPGRYGMHDLLRAYAAELAAAHDPDADGRAALTRLLDHYLAGAVVAARILFPAHQHMLPAAPAPVVADAMPADQAEAQRWLDRERGNLIAATAYAAARGWPDHAVAIPAAVRRYLTTAGRYVDALTLHTHALVAGRESGDLAGMATAFLHLGIAHEGLGRFEPAVELHRQGLAVAEQIGDRLLEGHARNNIGAAQQRRGRYAEAAEQYERALACYRETGQRINEADTLANLGVLYQWQGRYHEAYAQHERLLALYQQVGSRDGEADSLTNLGTAALWLGRTETAAEHTRRALAIYREIPDRAGEALALDNLGMIFQRQGDFRQARRHHGEALRVSIEIGNVGTQAEVVDNLGSLALCEGRPERARGHYRKALRLARRTGSRRLEARVLTGLAASLVAGGQLEAGRGRYQSALAWARELGDRHLEARTLDGMAGVCAATGEPAAARAHWQAALAIVTDLDLPDAAGIRRQLAALASPPHAATLSGTEGRPF